MHDIDMFLLLMLESQSWH